MKKLAIVLLLVVAAACRRQATTVGVSPAPLNATGGSTPREALRGFMDAARAQDLQAMASFWGSRDGPASATMDRSTLEQREIILACYLKHDSFEFVNESPATDGERIIGLSVHYRTLTRSSNFYLTPGPSSRWYVRTFDLDALRDICASR